MKDGGFEIEAYLKEKPDTNVFEFPITGADDLNFFYQAPDGKSDSNPGGGHVTQLLADRPKHLNRHDSTAAFDN